jgi:hypothetical protein
MAVVIVAGIAPDKRRRRIVADNPAGEIGFTAAE